MFKKQQNKIEGVRVRKEQARAKVFSYYQNRAPLDEKSKQNLPSGRSRGRPDRKSSASIFPVVSLGLALFVCVFYLSTLDSNPRIKISDSSAVDSGQNTVVGKKLSSYEPQVNSIFNQSFTNRSKLLIDSVKVSSQIEEKYPELGEVVVVLPFVGRRPVVNVLPSEPELILANGQGAYLVDIEGNALAAASEVDRSILSSLPVVQDQSSLQLKEGGPVLRNETVEFIKSVHWHFYKKDIVIESAFLPASTPYELHLRIKGEPYLVKFNTKGDSRLQSGTYFAVRDRLGGGGVVPENYVDVRVPEKAFYK